MTWLIEHTNEDITAKIAEALGNNGKEAILGNMFRLNGIIQTTIERGDERDIRLIVGLDSLKIAKEHYGTNSRVMIYVRVPPNQVEDYEGTGIYAIPNNMSAIEKIIDVE